MRFSGGGLVIRRRRRLDIAPPDIHIIASIVVGLIAIYGTADVSLEFPARCKKFPARSQRIPCARTKNSLLRGSLPGRRAAENKAFVAILRSRREKIPCSQGISHRSGRLRCARAPFLDQRVWLIGR